MVEIPMDDDSSPKMKKSNIEKSENENKNQKSTITLKSMTNLSNSRKKVPYPG